MQTNRLSCAFLQSCVTSSTSIENLRSAESLNWPPYSDRVHMDLKVWVGSCRRRRSGVKYITFIRLPSEVANAVGKMCGLKILGGTDLLKRR